VFIAPCTQCIAVFVRQEPVDVDHRRHGQEGHAYPLAFEVLGFGDAGLAVNRNEAMAERARRKNRKRDERALLIGETLDEFRAGIFRNIELLAARHAVEDRPRLIDGNEIELDAVRPDLAGIERLHAVVEPARERKLQLGHGGVPQVRHARA
jgi:hypothetical protein